MTNVLALDIHLPGDRAQPWLRGWQQANGHGGADRVPGDQWLVAQDDLAVPDENESHPLLGSLIEQTLVGETDEDQLYRLLAPYLIAL